MHRGPLKTHRVPQEAVSGTEFLKLIRVAQFGGC